MTKILLVCLLYSQIYCSQSIINNGGFDLKWAIPKKVGESHLIKNWHNSSASYYPVTYFYKYKEIGFLPKIHHKTMQYAHSDFGFIGLGFDLAHNKKNQYLVVGFNEKLIKDSLYKISMWVSLQDNIKYGINHINCYFLDKEVLPLRMYNAVELNAENIEFLADKNKWVNISGLYKANGSENYFVIGGAEKHKKIKTKFMLNFTYLIAKDFSYYFIDDVSVSRFYKSTNNYNDSLKLMDSKITEQINPNHEVKASRHFVLLFDPNESKINSYGITTLNSIIEKININTQISIYGYADTTGNKNFNLLLAEKRTNNVYKYLIDKGVKNDKIKCHTMGETDKEHSNMLNRKVEVIIN